MKTEAEQQARPLRRPGDVAIQDTTLAHLLTAHSEWLEQHPTGHHAFLKPGLDLSCVDLRGANLSRGVLRGLQLVRTDLSDAELSDCILTGADLTDANLSGANLENAEMAHVTLVGANLTNTNCRDSNLAHAVFRYTSNETSQTTIGGLTLGGADLTNAILPDSLDFRDRLKIVEAATKNSSHLFLGLMAALAYTLLTILTTRDETLLPNSVLSPLPIIRTPVPISAFYALSPWLILFVYIFLQHSISQLWRLISALPAKLPHGEAIDEVIHPWFLNSTLAQYLPRLRRDYRHPLVSLTAKVGVVAVWWLAPLIVVCLWLRYLRAHEWPSTVNHVLALCIFILCAWYSMWLSPKILRGRRLKSSLVLAPFTELPGRQAALICSIHIVLFTSISGISYSTVKGDLAARYSFLAADFRGKDVGSHVASSSLAEVGELRGADLSEKDMRFVRARKAGLAKADLRGARLKLAELREANLGGANLSASQLEEADLTGAKAHAVIATGANLTGAVLSGADFTKAVLAEAILRGAVLNQTNLKGANLKYADLTDAELRGTDLRGANLEGTVGWPATGLRDVATDHCTVLPDGSRGPLR